MRSFEPENIKKIPTEATRVFKGIIFDVYHWKQKLFDESFETFEMLKRADSVKIIAVKDRKIVVLEEEQPHKGPFYSFPGGRHDIESESELQAAQRELEEETGMRFSNWKLISAVQPYFKIDWVVYTFLATDFIDQKEQKLDAGEKVTVTLKTLEELKELIKDPKTRYLGEEIFENVNSIEELLEFPECSN